MGESKMPRVQVGHFSPDAPSVDVMVDGSMAFEGINFRETTDLADLDEGSHSVEVRPHGDDTSVITEEISLEDDMHYTVIAGGLLEENDIFLEIIAHPE